MRIAVIGAGGVGTAIAGRLAESGEDVALGVRDPAGASVAAVRGSIPHGVALESIASALARAEVVIVAIPGDQIPSFIRGHANDLAGRIVIDATNDLGAGHLGRMHHVADWQLGAPATQVFRAFNTMGWENFAAPQFDGVPADLFYEGVERVELELVERRCTGQPPHGRRGAGGVRGARHDRDATGGRPSRRDGPARSRRPSAPTAGAGRSCRRPRGDREWSGDATVTS